MEWVYLNTNFLKTEMARISIRDRGFLLGDGLFETLRYAQGEIDFFDAHWARLCLGCQVLEIPLQHTSEHIKENLFALIEKNNWKLHAVALRITVSRGESLERGLAVCPQQSPTLLLQGFMLPVSINRPLSLGYSTQVIYPDALLRSFKCLQYLPSIRAKIEVQKKGFEEAILYNHRGELVSASAANLFFWKGKTLYTPCVHVGALPGIMRAQLINFAKKEGYKVKFIRKKKRFVQGMEGAFLTNSIQRIRAVRCIEERICQPLPAVFSNWLEAGCPASVKARR